MSVLRKIELGVVVTLVLTVITAAFQLGGLADRVSSLSSRVASLDPRVASLDSHVARMDTLVASLDTQVAKLDPQAVSQAQQQAITAVHAVARQAGVQADVAQLSADVDTLRGTKSSFDATSLAGKRVEVGSAQLSFDRKENLKQFRVNFKMPFSSPPVVVGSVAESGASKSQAGRAALWGARFEIRDIASDPSGFEVRIAKAGYDKKINVILSYVVIGGSSP